MTSGCHRGQSGGPHAPPPRIRRDRWAPLAVAELWVIVMDVQCGVDQMRIITFQLADRVGPSTGRTPAWRTRAPGRSPPRESSRLRGRGPAGTSLWERVPSEVGSRPAQDLVLLLQLLGTAAQLPVLRLQVTSRSQDRHGCITTAVLAVGDPQPLRQAGLRDPEAASDLRSGSVSLRATAITSRRNSSGYGTSTVLILPARPQPHGQGVNRIGGSPLRPTVWWLARDEPVRWFTGASRSAVPHWRSVAEDPPPWPLRSKSGF